MYVIVLGIDPGVANSGYGVVAQHQGRMLALDGGVVRTAGGLDAGRRLAAIHERVCWLLDEYRPDALAVEDVYFGANARSAFAVGKVLGMLDRYHGRITGLDDGKPQQAAWMKSMRGERERRRRRSVLDTVMMISVSIALVLSAVWFFGFAGSSLPGG